jgi:membrane protease YdiL (CAAX protease family)
VASIAAFFGLTYLVSWTCFGAAFVMVRAAPGSAVHTLAAPTLLLGVFAPALVAMALTAHASGRTGIDTLLRRIIEPPVAWRWYAFAVFFYVGIKLLVAVVYRTLQGQWPTFGSDPWYILAFAIVFSTPVQAGEELGWRGFALPRLAARLGIGPASVVLGLIWAAWHLPLFYMPGSDTEGQSFPVYVIDVTALSVAIAWLYWKTGGRLLLTMLMHAAINNTKDIVPSAIVGATNRFALSTSRVAWITAALLWASAAWFLVDMRRRKS